MTARLVPWPKPAPRLDIAEVARRALPHLHELCERWLPGGRKRGKNWVCGSLSGGAGRSLKVNLRTGGWSDFATGDKGCDAVSLAAAVHRLSQIEAAQKVAHMLGMEGAANGR